jgi:RNA polymerase sigma-70 factor (ECF subfamily)
MGRLADAFVARYGGATTEDSEALERRLAGVVRHSRAQWPDVELGDEAFVGHLAARLPAGVALEEALDQVRLPDLYLACACAVGAPGAAETFDRHVLSRLHVLLSSLKLDRAALDETRQALADRLLVTRAGAPPRISEYEGRGPLEGWVRIVGLRAVFNARRGADRLEPLGDDPAQLLPGGGDPELEIIKTLHKEDFAAAFRAAFDELSPRERTLLGLHFLEGVPTLRLGPMYGVHRTTVARWLETAQHALLAGTRRRLIARLRLSPEECESLIHLLQSRLDVTLKTLLGG